MFEQEIHLRDYFRIIIKWRWMIVALLVLIVLAAAFYSFRQIPVYQATARILIEKNAPNIVSFADPGAANNSYYWDPNFMTTQSNIIKSRAVAERVLQQPSVRNLLIGQPKPEVSASEESSWRGWLSQIRKDFFLREWLSQIPKWLGEQEPPVLSEMAKSTTKEEQLARRLLGMISVTAVRESRLVDVSIRSSNPEQAAFMANILVEAYIQHNLETRIAASRTAVQWLVEEVETAREKVAESESALQKYKEQYGIISIEDRQNIVMQKLAKLSDAVSEAKIQRMSLEAQYEELQQFATGDLNAVPLISNDPVVQNLKVELLHLEREHLELLKKFRAKHPNIVTLQSQITGVQDQIAAEIQRIVVSLKKNYEMVLAQEHVLMEALEQQKQDALELDQKTIMHGILEQEVASNRRIYHSLLERMNETSVTERLETSNIQLVDRASISSAPIAPNRKRAILLAMIVGLMAGISLAFFLEYWNDKISTPEDLKQYLEFPFLGMIPTISVNHLLSGSEKTLKDTLIAMSVLVDPKSSVAEAYRSVRTHVIFSGLQHDVFVSDLGKTLLLTSAEPSEGKSSTVSNLGITMAQSGQKTLIIDCDFRKPRLEQLFNFSQPVLGLTDVLMDRNTDNGIVNVIRQTDIENLDVIPSGTIPSNPSALLSLEKFPSLLQKLRSQYNYILIDSPPVNVVTDPLILSSLVDGVIVVFHAEKTKRHIAQRARDELHNAGATILGGILNHVNIKKARYSSYYYDAYYYPKYYRKEEDKKIKKERAKADVVADQFNYDM